MKKLISLLFVLIMIFALFITVFAEYENKAPELGTTLFDQLANSKRTTKNITVKERTQAKSIGLDIVAKVTDASTLSQLVEEGSISLGEDGNLPDYLIIYKAADVSETESEKPSMVPFAGTSIHTVKTKYYDGRYFDRYDRYVVQGPNKFTHTYSKSDTANWTKNISGDVTLEGTVYKFATIKASVAGSMGKTIGQTYKKESTYEVNVPANKKWTIKVWNSFMVYNYSTFAGIDKLCSGKCWYPNGLIFAHTQTNA